MKFPKKFTPYYYTSIFSTYTIFLLYSSSFYSAFEKAFRFHHPDPFCIEKNNTSKIRCTFYRNFVISYSEKCVNALSRCIH